MVAIMTTLLVGACTALLMSLAGVLVSEATHARDRFATTMYVGVLLILLLCGATLIVGIWTSP